MRVQSVIACICMVPMWWHSVSTAFAAKSGYIEQKPIFDTTYLPKPRSPFKLDLKHTDIVYPAKLSSRGDVKVVDLRTEQTATVLKGGVTSQAAQTTIHTVEHGIKPTFHLDLTALIPKIAPDISRQLESAIDRARHNLAASADNLPRPADMKPQSPKTAPTLPIPKPASPKLSAQIDAAKPTSPRVPINTTDIAGQADALRGNGGGGGGGSGGASNAGGFGGGIMPPHVVATTPTMPKAPTSLPKVPKDIQSIVSAPLKQPVATKDLSAQMRTAVTRAHLAAQNADPQLLSERTRTRLMSSPAIPNTANVLNGELLKPDAVILWDEWHRRFANLAGDALIKSINAAGNPRGTNTISVTVYPDQRLKLFVKTSGGSTFDTVVLHAYRSLNGHPLLAYPSRSLRSSVTFLVDNKHTSSGSASAVRSEISSGDKEVLKQPSH
jgi:hypothetical protein